MLSFLPGPVLGCICVLLASLNTILVVPLLYVATIFKLIVPLPGWRRMWSPILAGIGEIWIWGNSTIIRATQRIDWDVEGLKDLSRQSSYFITCNHQSWVDIIVLQHIFNRTIPFIRFFLKQQLLYFPLLGAAWWALDFPFLKRYSTAQILAHPELRNRDLESTRKACERFRGLPVSILNFLEGTRFRPEKHDKQKSPYRHLLKPKAGGFAFALEAMGDQFAAILDVTIVFPDGATRFWDLVTGRMRRIVVRVSQYEIPAALLQGPSIDEAQYRQIAKDWVNDLWVKKDEMIESLTPSPQTCSAT
ncbi:MAG: acyltransferase [Bdellovibrionales bacterium]|nr:acyltransferase [Bdellovibrionales bacterium]